MKRLLLSMTSESFSTSHDRLYPDNYRPGGWSRGGRYSHSRCSIRLHHPVIVKSEYDSSEDRNIWKRGSARNNKRPKPRSPSIDRSYTRSSSHHARTHRDRHTGHTRRPTLLSDSNAVRLGHPRKLRRFSNDTPNDELRSPRRELFPQYLDSTNHRSQSRYGRLSTVHEAGSSPTVSD